MLIFLDVLDICQDMVCVCSNFALFLGQTDKQTSKQTDRPTDIQTEKQTNIQTETQAETQTDKQTDRQTDIPLPPCRLLHEIAPMLQ